MLAIGRHFSELGRRGKLQVRAAPAKPKSAGEWLLLAAMSAGVGMFPIAPATVASAATAAAKYFFFPAQGSWITVAAVSVIGIALGYPAERAFGKDPRAFVLDEIAGQLIVFLFFPATWPTCLLGFVAFRFFDVAKVPPASWLERLPAGWGIVLDDIAAGLYAAGFVAVSGFVLARLGMHL